MTAVSTAPVASVLRVADLDRRRFAALLDLAEAMKHHPLPWRDTLKGEEVDAAVIDGPDSLVWAQAANRLPTEQALLSTLITGNWEA